ncbi:hypothetical protein Poli38472_002956 [Pythium oligandrum]|uniref:tRNA-binding domain-containing protein n=1 Tax=Pythium oligandrum TaxID=41045 RepID=A0A8K1FCC2_PYTOL|nr:hypothetical protein Poli38472_002956 [Pythium oligandrum]|eukprot:TMW57031.1 hypothetical protein Poli38472_002956 [Pythium oligandrum]
MLACVRVTTARCGGAFAVRRGSSVLQARFLCSADRNATVASDVAPVAKVPATPSPPPVPQTTWNSIVVGEIVDLHRHPEADRLNVCQVNVGDAENLIQIICGAPNARQGARVPVAKVGTKLAIKDTESGELKLLKIKKSKLRGEVSQGMICSEAELGLAEHSGGILIFDDDAPIGSLVQDWHSVASRLVKDIPAAEPSADQ